MGLNDEIAKHSLPRPAPTPSPSPSMRMPSSGGSPEQTARTITWGFIIGGGVLTFLLGYIGFIIGVVLVAFFLIRNKMAYGKVMPGQGNGTVAALLIIVLIVIALLPIIMGLGFSGIISGVDALALGTKGTVEQGASAYVQTLYQAMGLSYASQVDEHADEDLGVALKNIETTQQYYSSSDPVTIWGIIDAKALGDRTINLSLSCWHEQRESKLKEIIKTAGRITPTDKYVINDEMNNDFRCEFPQGVLSDKATTANRFVIKGDFNFQTMSYLTATFLDQDAYLALRQSDPARLTALQQPVAKNSYGPISLGIGSKDSPIIVSTNSIQSQPYVGFSLTNNWQGHITNLTAFSVLMPKGIELIGCDGETDMILQEDKSTDFFNNYTMNPEGLRYISDKITKTEGINEFVPQSFKCFMKVDTSELFASRSRLDPVSRNIFAFAEYNYALEEERSVVVQTQYEDFSVVLTPSIVGLQSRVTYKVKKNRLFGTITDVKLNLKYRKANEMDSSSLEEYQNIDVPRDANGDYEGQFTKTLSEMIPELHKGDSIIFEFTVKLGSGDVKTVIQSVKILNNPPRIVDQPTFTPTSPGTLDDVLCTVIVEDDDGDPLQEKSITFKNKNTQQTYRYDNIACQENEKQYTCQGILPAKYTSEGDVITCSASFSDGVDYSLEVYDVQVQIQSGSSANPDDEPITVCEDSDNGIIRTIKGSISGVNADGNQQSLTDFCENGNLVEYYCENNIIKSQKYPCECSNGVCINE